MIARHGLHDGPLEILFRDVRDKPREGLAVKSDLLGESGRHKKVGEDEVSNELKTGVV